MRGTVCIIGNIYSTFSRGNQGGGEGQLLYVAKLLKATGLDVTIVDTVIDSPETTEEGIRFVPVTMQGKTNFFHKLTKRMFLLHKTLVKLNSDYYFSAIMGYSQFIPLIVSKKLNAKFFYWVAADIEVEGFISRFKNEYKTKLSPGYLYSLILNELLFPWVLKYADKIFVQHINQQKLIKFRESIILSNVIDVKPSHKRKSDYIIWVGSLDFNKGFHLLEKVVVDLPGVNFKIIGKVRNRECIPILDRITKLKNVEYHGFVDKNETVSELVAGSKGFINTSPKEGFPITFIEAWAVNTPVYSLFVDPGDVINLNNLGFCAHGEYSMFLERLAGSTVNGQDYSHLRNYYEVNHGIESFKMSLFRHFTSQS